jgi:hypothetical protein
MFNFAAVVGSEYSFRMAMILSQDLFKNIFSQMSDKKSHQFIFSKENNMVITSKDVQSYWNNLYTFEPQDGKKVLPFDPLIHRGNVFSDLICDVYVRDCYDELYDERVKNNNYMKHFFVTGTPGLGKSVFTSYVVWRQI